MRAVGHPAALDQALTARAETWYADGSVAAGGIVGRLAWDKTGDLHLDDTVLALAIGLEGFYGPEIADGVAVGLGVDATLLTAADAHLGSTSYNLGYELAATASMVVRARTHVWRASAGAAIAGFGGGGVSVVIGERGGGIEMTRGPVARASISWPIAKHVHFAIEARAGYLFSDHMSYVPVMLAAALHLEHADVVRRDSASPTSR